MRLTIFDSRPCSRRFLTSGHCTGVQDSNQRGSQHGSRPADQVDLNTVRMHGFPLKSDRSPLQRAPSGSTPGRNARAGRQVQRGDEMLGKGGRVVLTNGVTGVVQWIGMLDSKYVQTEVKYGIKLDEAVGR